MCRSWWTSGKAPLWLEEQNRRIQADETGRTDPSRLKRKHRIDMNDRDGKERPWWHEEEGTGVRQRRIKMIREGWKVEVRKEGLEWSGDDGKVERSFEFLVNETNIYRCVWDEWMSGWLWLLDYGSCVGVITLSNNLTRRPICAMKIWKVAKASERRTVKEKIS